MGPQKAPCREQLQWGCLTDFSIDYRCAMCLNKPRMQSSSYTLPSPHLPLTEEGICLHTLAVLAAVGLQDWSFGWDCAKRRLGCCHYGPRRITLSAYFVRHFMEKDPQLILTTILHEVAHALAYTRHSELRHGACWRHYCTLLGIPGEKARAKCESFAPSAETTRPCRYILRHKETGEIFHRYVARPRTTRRRLASAYIRGRKAETLGKLEIAPMEEAPTQPKA